MDNQSIAANTSNITAGQNKTAISGAATSNNCREGRRDEGVLTIVQDHGNLPDMASSQGNPSESYLTNETNNKSATAAVSKAPLPRASTSGVAQITQTASGTTVSQPNKDVHQLQIEKIIGMSQSGCSGNSYAVDGAISSATSISISPKNGDIAYVAGAFIVIHGMKSSRQEKFLKHQKCRAFQCVVFSPDGNYLAAGASCLRSPDISLWTVSENDKGRCIYKFAQTLIGHKYGIQSLRFSPNSDLLVSIGDQSDKGVLVWDVSRATTVKDQTIQPQSARAMGKEKNGNGILDNKSSKSGTQLQCLMSSNQVSSIINTFAFHPSQKYMVTVGFSHLKIWDFKPLMEQLASNDTVGNSEKQSIMKSINSSMQTVSGHQVLQPKSVDLSKVKQKIFVGVSCHNNLIYALTSGGHLNIFNEEGKLSKWMDIQVARAFYCAIDSSKDLLYCGCADGIIRIFNAKTLEHIVTNQKPPPLGQTNIESGVKKIKVEKSQKSKYADVLAIIADEPRSRFLAVYSDNMVFLWEYQDVKKIQVIRTFMSHNGTIHDIQLVNQNFKVGITDTEEGQKLQKELSLTRFVTCASDRTLRFWHFIDTQNISPQNKQQVQKGLFRNAYCKDMSKIIFVKNQDDLMKHNFDVFKAKPIDRGEDGTQLQDNDEATIRKAQDIEQAIRCLRLTHDGKYIGCGDWHGNIRIHDLQSATLEESTCIEAHETEVLSIDFTRRFSAKSVLRDAVTDSNSGYLLASGSRDQLIQIYDSTVNYEEIQIIEDHEAAVTTVRFVEEKTYRKESNLMDEPLEMSVSLISGGADKQMIKYSLSMGQEITDLDPFQLQAKETLSNKIFSLDVAQNASNYVENEQAYMPERVSNSIGLYQRKTGKRNPNSVTTGNPCVILGHDRILTLRGTEKFQRIWEKRPDPRRKFVPDYLKVMIDETGSVLVTSGTDKCLNIFDTESGSHLCKAQCGELTTGMCFSQNGRHLITTSCIGVIYIWKLPETVICRLNRFKCSSTGKKCDIHGLQLDQIDEDENEDSLRRPNTQDIMQNVMTPDKLKQQQQSIQESSQNANLNVQNDLQNVFAQIKQVETQIEGAQAANVAKTPTHASSTGSIANKIPLPKDTSQKVKQQDLVPPKQTGYPSSVSKGDYSAISNEPQTPLNFPSQKNLPRWALSIASMNTDAHKRSEIDAEAVGADKDDCASMQNLFEQNLKDLSHDQIRKDNTQDQQLQQKIDLLDNNDEDDDELMMNVDDNQDNQDRISKLKLNQFESIYGIGGTNESHISSDLRRSRDFFSKKSGSKARQSIAGKFKLKRETESHCTTSALGAGQQQISSDTHLKSPQNGKSIVNAAEQLPVKEQQKSVPLKMKDLPAEITGLMEPQSSVTAANDGLSPRSPLLLKNQYKDQKVQPKVSLDDTEKQVIANTDLLGDSSKDKKSQGQDGQAEKSDTLDVDDIALSLKSNTKETKEVPKAEGNGKNKPTNIAESKQTKPKQDLPTQQAAISKSNDKPAPKNQTAQNSPSKIKKIEEPKKENKQKLEESKKSEKMASQSYSTTPVTDQKGKKNAESGAKKSKKSESKCDDGVASSSGKGSMLDSQSSNKLVSSRSVILTSEQINKNIGLLQNNQKESVNEAALLSRDNQNQSVQQSHLSVPLPSVSGASTQTLSPEANSMVNFQLQFELQRINDSLKNIGQILEKSNSLVNQSQNFSSVQSSQALFGQLPVQGSIVGGPNQDGAGFIEGIQGSFAQTQSIPIINLDNQIQSQLSQSLNLWNNMIQKMQNSTTIDVQEVQRQSFIQGGQAPDFGDRASSIGSVHGAAGGNSTNLIFQSLSVTDRQSFWNQNSSENAAKQGKDSKETKKKDKN